MKTTHPRFSKINAEVAGIPKDEPVFLIRARDIHAAKLVRTYADRVAAVNGDPGIVAAARQLAVEMDAWPEKKAPDLFRDEPVLRNSAGEEIDGQTEVAGPAPLEENPEVPRKRR